MPIVKTQQSDPTTLTLPQRRIGGPQKAQGGNRNPKHTQNTIKSPRNQYRHPVANNLPNKPTTNHKTNTTRRKQEKRTYRVKTGKVGLKTANAVTVTTQILPAKNPKASLKNEGTQKAEDKALSETNAEGKMQSEGSVCYL